MKITSLVSHHFLFDASFVIMKTILTTLNAKYIHTSLALRWLYVANKDKTDLSFQEYTIKEDINKIAEDILRSQCDIIGISVSIWNVTQTERLVNILKMANPDLIIITGGPEVMYEPAYFLDKWPIDYVISGEGEFVLGELLERIKSGENYTIKGVSSRIHIDKTIVRADLAKLALLPSPYMLEEDNATRKHKLVYFETSRGCPYQCGYCLSSLEKGVRYFPKEYILSNLDYLLSHHAKQIKFLDRTFNLNKQHTRTVFDYLITNYREGLSCQFEIYADLLDDEIINYLNNNLPPHFFRFEIGIQSTFEPTNVAVNRKQNFPLLADNIHQLMAGGKIDLHLDLIAGLPYETFERFVKSFNDVFELRAKEVQLGFLKMLRGTPLRLHAEKFGYKYNENAPYEIVCNDDISPEKLQRIHRAEHMLDKFWNSGRFNLTLRLLFESEYKGKYFEFFDELGCFYEQQAYPYHHYQLEDLFSYLQNFIHSKGLDLFETLRKDYYMNFTRKPPGFWEDLLGKKRRNQLLYLIGQDKEFLNKHKLTRKMIEKYTSLDPLNDGTYLLTLFLPETKEAPIHLIYKKSFADLQS